jgi:hypothetical protein
MKRTTIRGVRIKREGYVPPDRVDEDLRYTIDVYDARDNFIECLGRLHDLDAAIAAFNACRAKYPDRRIFLRQRGRVIRRYDEPIDADGPEADDIKEAAPRVGASP